MIVSGGENVFPAEVEDLLMGHENVAEVAVFGVEDEKFGQRLKAVVVKKGSLSAKDVQDTSRRTSPGTRSHATWCSSTSFLERPPGRCSSGS